MFLLEKSKVVYTSQLKPLYTAFLHSIKLFVCKMRTNFDRDPLAVKKKSSYATKIVNSYIVYHLDNWAKNPLRNFILKNCLFGTTSI